MKRKIKFAKQGVDLSQKYPLVGFKEKPWAEQYFKNNTLLFYKRFLE